MISKIFNKFRRHHCPIDSVASQLGSLSSKIDSTLLLMGKLLSDQNKNNPARNIQEKEFKVFSQWGDDGIIQYLTQQLDLPLEYRRFIEFGVEDYTEANTRFLLLKDNWEGLVIDSNQEHIETIRNRPEYWRHSLKAVKSFITKENIGTLLRENGFTGPIGILSIDLDGNDYWVWEQIEEVDAIIVIIEYNSLFGRDRALTIPYSANFQRTQAHHSNLYWGASFRALCLLAKKKGYTLVGSNSHGNNLYFVQNAWLGNLSTPTWEEAYVNAQFRESRDESGRLTYLSGETRQEAIQDLPVWDLEKGQLVTLRECLK